MTHFTDPMHFGPPELALAGPAVLLRRLADTVAALGYLLPEFAASPAARTVVAEAEEAVLADEHRPAPKAQRRLMLVANQDDGLSTDGDRP